MDFTNNSLINIINFHTSNYIKQIDYFKRYIEHLKKHIEYQTINIKYYNQLKQCFNDLVIRHNELKQNYIEIEQENARLQKQNRELNINQESLMKDVEQYFKTSNKQINEVSPTQQQTNKPGNHIDPNYFQNFQYESSDDESVDSECKHVLNLDLLSKQSKAYHDKLDSLNQSFTQPTQTSNIYNDNDNGNLDIEIMKKLIGKDLMNELEKSNDFEEKDKTSEKTRTINPFNSQFIIPNTVPNNNMFIFHSNTQPNELGEKVKTFSPARLSEKSKDFLNNDQTKTKKRIKKHHSYKYSSNNTSSSQAENNKQLDSLLNSFINLASK
jgi:hypothetical protein